ncbi:hypothetical protein SO694_00143041 [Aureococcus anophagefferens]|uniref:ShKT domain-containing protein n=1 Tax=Aureococcus anophagefferens TaxID=44056 RepID=A0ABR1FPU3_AURAN
MWGNLLRLFGGGKTPPSMMARASLGASTTNGTIPAGSESGAVSAGGGSFDSACTDSTTWHKKGDDKKNCAWVGKKKVNRCKAWVKSEDGVLASVACPVACDTCLLICEEAKQDLEETLAEEKQTCAEEKQTCAEEKQTCAEEKAALEGPSRGLDDVAPGLEEVEDLRTCAVNKYVDNNECLECPASATCDGVNAVCDDVNKARRQQRVPRVPG